jgi:hypothetical protein
MDLAAHQRFEKIPANDNRAAASRALRELAEAAIERVLGVAGALRFALLVAGI